MLENWIKAALVNGSNKSNIVVGSVFTTMTTKVSDCRLTFFFFFTLFAASVIYA